MVINKSICLRSSYNVTEERDEHLYPWSSRVSVNNRVVIRHEVDKEE